MLCKARLCLTLLKAVLSRCSKAVPHVGNPEWGCILQPKVAVLSYLGNYGGLGSNPERVATFTVGKMSFGHCCASTT